MEKKNSYDVAVVGATGAVGSEMIAVLEERAFPVNRLLPLASENSVGKNVTFCGKSIPIEVLNKDSFKGIDIALFSAGGSVSSDYAPIAAKAGALVVDNSSTFRMESDVPLVVPEANAGDCANWKKRGIVANPNCSTIQLCAVLKPLHDAVGIKRVVVSTYQSTSGAGQKGMDEMVEQVRATFSNEKIPPQVFPHTIAFNCIPHIDKFLENGYTKEEWKVITETRKILNLPDLPITCTAVRVPVFVSHAESVNIEFNGQLSAEDARDVLKVSPGILLQDDPVQNLYPLQRDVAGNDPVYVGRIREDKSVKHGIDCWIVSDNLRKGAALNAVQIAEIVINKYV